MLKNHVYQKNPLPTQGLLQALLPQLAQTPPQQPQKTLPQQVPSPLPPHSDLRPRNDRRSHEQAFAPSSSPSTGQNRVFCPILCRPDRNSVTSTSFPSIAGIRNHVKDHCAGSFIVAIPAEFLVRGVCPRCRLQARAAAEAIEAVANDAGAAASNSGASRGLPSFDRVCTRNVRLLKHEESWQTLAAMLEQGHGPGRLQQ
jgi:hypothetical protein